MGAGSGTSAAGKRKLPANLYWRGDVIWARVKADGSEHRRSLRTNSVPEAKARFEVWRKGIERGRFGLDEHSFMDALVKWTKEVLPGAVKPAVMRRYLASMTMLDAVFGKMNLSQVNEAAISRYISTRAGNVTNATIRRDLTALSKMLSACIAWGWIDRNPAKFFDRSIVKERKRTLSLPTDDEIEYVLAIAPPPMVPLLRFLAATGMRENEAVTLVGENVDHVSRTITLEKTKSSRPRRLNWKTPAMDAADILMPLAAQKTGILFPNRDGGVYRNISSNFGKVMRDAIRRADDEDVPFRRWRAHDLRHRFAVRWLQAGGDIYRLSRHLGHTSVKTTEHYLDHLTEDEYDDVRGVARKVAQG